MNCGKSQLELFALLGVLTVCLSACPSKRIIARVGDYDISRGDAELRDQVSKIEHPGSGAKNSGLEELVRHYQMAYIVRSYGYDLDEGRIAQEMERINRQTQVPESLRKIKAIFGGDMEAYRKVYVLPILAARVIYFEVFAKSPAIQASALVAPQSLISETVSRPAEFREWAERKGLHVSRWQVNESGITLDGKAAGGNAPERVTAKEPDPIAAHLEAEDAQARKAEATRIIHDALAKLRPGKVYPRPIDRGDHWTVARLTHADRAKNRYVVDAVDFPKASFQDWLRAAREKVPVARF